MQDGLSHTDELAIDIIVDLLESQTGQRISGDRRRRIPGALGNLLRDHKLDNLQQLIIQLTSSDDDTLARMVVEALLNNETYFFRDRQVFDHLAADLLPLLARKRLMTRQLRVWSVGCSTGQEPLSLAMLFAENSSAWANWQIDILATDVSQQMIDLARESTYSNFQIQRGLGVKQMLEFFTESPAGWQAKACLKSKVRYDVHSILNPSPSSQPFDLILCRNVLLYFDQKTRQRAYARLAEALAPDGLLILGGGELVMGREGPFVPAETRHGIFCHNPDFARAEQAIVS